MLAINCSYFLTWSHQFFHIYFPLSDSNQAAAILDNLQQQLWDIGDHSYDDNLLSLISMLESPNFQQLLCLQESIQELSHQVTQGNITSPSEFQFTRSAELVIAKARLQQGEESAQNAVSNHYYNVEFQRAIENAAQGREVETIKMFKPNDSTLGFSVVGLKGERQEELGIFVKDIQAGGTAAR